jgi:hypothetical protein
MLGQRGRVLRYRSGRNDMTIEMVRSELAGWLAEQELIGAAPTEVASWKDAAVKVGSGGVSLPSGNVVVYPRSVYATEGRLSMLLRVADAALTEAGDQQQQRRGGGAPGVTDGRGKYLVIASPRGFFRSGCGRSRRRRCRGLLGLRPRRHSPRGRRAPPLPLDAACLPQGAAHHDRDG